jgi:hypothetical protein
MDSHSPRPPPEHEERLARSLASLEIDLEGRVWWEGEPISGAPAAPGSDPVILLGQVLYARLFAAFRPNLADAGAMDSDAFLADLRAAARPDEWTAGWRVLDTAPYGALAVERDGRRRLAKPGHYASFRVGGQIDRGSRISLWSPGLTGDLQPGFHHFFGRTAPDTIEESRLVRFYFNVKASAAGRVLRAVSQALDLHHIPFTMKIASALPRHLRIDAAVLYVWCWRAEIVEDIVTALAGADAQAFNPETPIFTRRILPGLATADDPGAGESFGEHRCRLVACGLLEAKQRGAESLAERVSTVRSAFEANGVDWSTPQLNMERPARERPRFDATALCPSSHSDGLLAAAQAIAARICVDAVWDGDRCTWLNCTPVGAGNTEAIAAARADLYDGTLGIALFLAEINAASPYGLFSRTALGALAHAHSQSDRFLATASCGFHAGIAGAAWAVWRAGALLDHPGLAARARALADHLADRKPASREIDIIDGCAGAIPVLLRLGQAYASESLIEAAVRHGEHLLDQAQTTAGGVSWRSENLDTHGNLTGYSHGVSGVATSLLELHRAIGRPVFREIAEEALRYERGWYIPELRNWRDLRNPHAPGRPPDVATAWCHGAPGIGIARLRCMKLLGRRGDLEEDLDAALATTQESLGSMRSHCLCHGSLGNAELFLLADQRGLGKAFAGAAQRAAEAAVREVAAGEPWRCGTMSGRVNYGLMTGLAGIGYQLLRTRAPNVVESVLLAPGPSVGAERGGDA